MNIHPSHCPAHKPTPAAHLRDAGTVLLSLLGKAHEPLAWAGSPTAGLDSCFQLAIHEYVYCPDCNMCSHDARYPLNIMGVQVGMGWGRGKVV